MNITQLHQPNFCPNCGCTWSSTTTCEDCHFHWTEDPKPTDKPTELLKPTKKAPRLSSASKPTTLAPKPKGPAPQHTPSKPQSSPPQPSPSKPTAAPPKPTGAAPKTNTQKPQRKPSPRIENEEHPKKVNQQKKKI